MRLREKKENKKVNRLKGEEKEIHTAPKWQTHGGCCGQFKAALKGIQAISVSGAGNSSTNTAKIIRCSE